MPHFVVHCSEDLLALVSEQEINQQVHCVANDTELFDEADIKVRVQSFASYSVGNQKQPFIHVFASIMQGRSEAQRAGLSRDVVTRLSALFPDVANIAMNADEFEKRTYCNRRSL